MAASASRAIYKSNTRSETTLTAGTQAQGRARCSSTGCHIHTASLRHSLISEPRLSSPNSTSLRRNHLIPEGSFWNGGTSPCQAHIQVTLMPTARHSPSALACWGPSLAQGQLTWQWLLKVGTGSKQLAKDCSVRVQSVLPWKGLVQAPL